MFFFLIFGFIILSGIVATIRFPKLTSRLTSKLPKFKYSKWFSNPKIKTLLQDREFFNNNSSKILTGSLFVILGNENYKLYNMFAPKDSYGVTKNFESSEEAFEILEYHGAKFIFFHPKLMEIQKDNQFNSRTRLLISRISKYRTQNYIDGIVILPNEEALKKSDALPSKELVNEINFGTHVFQLFSKFFKIRIPLYFIAHDVKATDERALKNIFKHDGENTDLYLGFSCDFLKKPTRSKLYEFFQSSMTNFVNVFNKKTISILNQTNSNGMAGAHIAYVVQEENALLSKNYISFFLNYFDAYHEMEFSHIAILNSILFASYDGSTPSESIKNIFYYLAEHGKDKLIFAERFLNHRRRMNILFATWTIVFAGGGLLAGWWADRYLYEKRAAYISNSIVVYQKFAKMFNEILSNKFPFAAPDAQQNVSFENVAYVIAKFQNILESKQAYFFTHVTSLTQRPDIQTFIDDMQMVITFLHLQTIEAKPQTGSSQTETSQATSEEKPLPNAFTLGVAFNFRVHPQDEYLANRIVDWSLTSGKQNYGSKYGEQTHIEFQWIYGDPLNFTVEFYSKAHKNYDSSLSPQKRMSNSQVKSNEHMYVQGNTVIFSYTNDAWSLIRFVEDHDICSHTKIPCPQALLQFIIPLANQSNGVFFCSLELQDTDGKSLTVPTFPKVAPFFAKAPNY